MKKLFLAAITLLMAACSQEQVVLPEPELPTPSTRSTRIPLKDALKVADRMIRAIEPEGTRSTARTVESVEFFGGSSTRGGDEEPLYYVVNYANDEGFAVLGADTRVDSIYAFSDEGHLDMNDTTFNEGLNMFFRSIAINNPVTPNPIDSFPQDFPVIIVEKTIDHSYTYGPLLTPSVRKWHQESPFNKYCPIGETGNPCVVGCTAIAIAQIMSVYEHPVTYGEYNFNWAFIKNNYIYPGIYDDGGLARLLRELGKSGNLDMDYGVNGSKASAKNVRRTFKNFGYEEPEDFDNFSTERLASFLKRNKPVLVGGKKEGHDTGHAWVVDGVHYDSWEYIGPLGHSFYGEGYFFHCVWGWGGSCNGYFKHESRFKYSSKFQDPNDGAPESTIDEDTSYYGLDFCGEINPK